MFLKVKNKKKKKSSKVLARSPCCVLPAGCRIKKSLRGTSHVATPLTVDSEPPARVPTLFPQHSTEAALRLVAFLRARACFSLYAQIKTLHLSAPPPPRRGGRPKENQSGSSGPGAEAVIKRCGRRSRTPAPAVPELCPRRIDFYTLSNTSEPPRERVDSLPSLGCVSA